MKKSGFSRLIYSLALLTLTACGGGGGTPATVETPAATSILTGLAAKGPVRSGTVKVFAIRNGAEDRSAPIGQGQTDGSGLYSINLGAYTGPVVVEVTGGSFIDEVSGTAVPLTAPLRALVSNVLIGSQAAAVTPLTELAYRKAVGAGSLTATSIDTANSAMGALFSLTDIVGSLPGTGTDASEEAKKYAFALGTFSQLVNDSLIGAETRADALSRLIAQMGNEMQTGGGFSIGTITGINSAIAAFAGGGSNQTGATITPVPTPTSGVLKLSTGGTSAIIGAIDVTITLPAGITIASDPATGETLAGVVKVSGVASSAGGTLATGRFTPASVGSAATLRVNILNAAGFGLGEFATIRFDLETGAGFPATTSAFTLSGLTAIGLNGFALNGITATPATLGGLL